MSQDAERTHQVPDSGDIHRAIEALSEGFALFDDEDRLLLCNQRFHESYPGLQGVLAAGLPWSIFVREASRRSGTRELDLIDQHLANGLETPLTLQSARPGDRWVRMGLHPIKDGGFVITETDTTDAHAAEEMRAEADNVLREVLDACASRIVMSRVDDGEIIYQTPAWRRLYGDADVAKSLYANEEHYSDLLAELLATKSVDDFETTMVRADGERFPARLSGRLIDFAGESAIVASSEDMTQIYAQRDQIVLTNQRLLDAIEALDQGFVIFDSAHRLLMANRPYLEVNAELADKLVRGAHNDELVTHALSIGHEPRAVGWTRTGELNAHFEFSLQDGRVFSASRRIASDGGFVLAWRDVSEQKKIERELARRREAAIQNEKLNALGQLLAGVAHELNNPLSVVVGYAMMLQDEVADPEARESVDKIGAAAEHCAKIVKTFLAMARQQPVSQSPTSLNDTIDTALDVASYGLRKAGIRIDRDLDPTLPEIFADEDQITQVFINLFVNAEQALGGFDRETRIEISTYFDADSDQVVAVVSDNGPGVPESIRARIFEPFFTTKSVGKGTGIGLSLSHRIVASHGGTLALEPSKRGARFVLSLPRNVQTESTATEATKPASALGLRALVVEDEPEVSAVLKKMLATLGVDATCAATGERALTILKSDSDFDVVLCDLKMPGMGGRALLERLQLEYPRIAKRLAFVTGDSMSADADAVRADENRRLLEKPVSPTELATLVQQLVDNNDTD